MEILDRGFSRREESFNQKRSSGGRDIHLSRGKEQSWQGLVRRRTTRVPVLVSGLFTLPFH